jgi:hypothetical protein
VPDNIFLFTFICLPNYRIAWLNLQLFVTEKAVTRGQWKNDTNLVFWLVISSFQSRISTTRQEMNVGNNFQWIHTVNWFPIWQFLPWNKLISLPLYLETSHFEFYAISAMNTLTRSYQYYSFQMADGTLIAIESRKHHCTTGLG